MCLIEHGIDLWYIVIYNSGVLTQELENLFQTHWGSCMKEASDYFRGLIKVLTSYLLLGGGDFVTRNHSDISESLIVVLPEMTNETDCIGDIMQVLSDFVQLFPQQSPNFLKPIIQIVLEQLFQDLSQSSEIDQSNSKPSYIEVFDTKVDVNGKCFYKKNNFFCLLFIAYVCLLRVCLFFVCLFLYVCLIVLIFSWVYISYNVSSVVRYE